MEESANKFKDEELILYGSVMYLFVYTPDKCFTSFHLTH